MKGLVVLSHLMSKNCELGVESVARSQLAIQKFQSDEYEFLITIGWAYRDDSDVAISHVVRDYILDNSTIEPHSIISLPSSRDTVGDAYFSLKHLQDSSLDELHIVTSDYHLNRATLIFEKIFNNRLIIKGFGAPTSAINDIAILEHEKKSIQAFEKTFVSADFSNIQSIYTALSTHHPFYNGDIYPKI